jgi:peroxiredoxin Q/BCP
MSKKTRKKSPKATAAKAPRAASAKSAKAPQTKTRPAKAAKTAGNATRKPAKAAKLTKKPIKKATKAESQKAPSKPLKSAGPKAPALSRVSATAPQVSHPQVSEPAAARTAAPATSPPMPRSVPAPAADSAPESVAKTVAKTDVKTVAKSAAKSGLTEGAKAPAFHLPRDGGGTVSSSDHAGRKLVLFFYPRADTPGCTKEAIDFTRLAGAFAESQTAVLGVSADPPKAQEAFRDKHQLATPLVSDEQHEMLEAYGVWGEKSMYGRTFLGIVRTTVLIGADGRVLKIWRNVKVDGHADEVLATVRAL